VPVEDLKPPSRDALEWVVLHGTVDEEGYVEFDNPCAALTERGACDIYADRPQVCKDFAPGGKACLDTVRKRRSPAEYELIREKGDPVEVHGIVQQD
jgi:Fe-S-cluster containining protein